MARRFPWDGLTLLLGAAVIVYLISLRSDRMDRMEARLHHMEDYARATARIDSMQCHADSLIGARLVTVETGLGIGGEK